MTNERLGMMRPEAKQVALDVKGFLLEREGLTLFELAAASAGDAPCLEIGSYCGKSTIFLAEGCRIAGVHPLFSVDHHRGSEEQQPAQQYFDADLFDQTTGRPTTLTVLWQTLCRADLIDWAIPIVADSQHMSRYWCRPLSLLFIDGGHSEEDVFGDFNAWTPHIISRGYLCVHDVFPDAADGGQAPYHMVEHARRLGAWDYRGQIDTLAILQRR